MKKHHLKHYSIIIEFIITRQLIINQNCLITALFIALEHYREKNCNEHNSCVPGIRSYLMLPSSELLDAPPLPRPAPREGGSELAPFLNLILSNHMTPTPHLLQAMHLLCTCHAHWKKDRMKNGIKGNMIR